MGSAVFFGYGKVGVAGEADVAEGLFTLDLLPRPVQGVLDAR